MTLRRAKNTIRFRGADCAVYELWFAWGEEAASDDRDFFRPIIETAPFQRALDQIPRPIVQVQRGDDDHFRLRVLSTTVGSGIESAFLPEALEV